VDVDEWRGWRGIGRGRNGGRRIENTFFIFNLNIHHLLGFLGSLRGFQSSSRMIH
jgi:hypothetical protein